MVFVRAASRSAEPDRQAGAAAVKVVAIGLVVLLVLGTGLATILSSFGGDSGIDPESVSPEEAPVVAFIGAARDADCDRLWAQMTEGAVEELERVLVEDLQGIDGLDGDLDSAQMRADLCEVYSRSLADAVVTDSRIVDQDGDRAIVLIQLEVQGESAAQEFGVVRVGDGSWRIGEQETTSS